MVGIENIKNTRKNNNTTIFTKLSFTVQESEIAYCFEQWACWSVVLISKDYVAVCTDTEVDRLIIQYSITIVSRDGKNVQKKFDFNRSARTLLIQK